MSILRPSMCEIALGELLKGMETNFVIPRYQREYAWEDDQIERLLLDLWCAYKAKTDRYYLGSLVVTPCAAGKLETIDGQQRLTTISLLFGLMKNCSRSAPIVEFSARKDCNDFLKSYCHNGKIPEKAEENPKLRSFLRAITCMRDFKYIDEGGNEVKVPLDDEGFREFILKKVIIFKILMPSGTDAMAYFEVMNNRGEQLEDHELLKAKLLEHLHSQLNRDKDDTYSDLSRKFNRIWMACSNMNGNLVDHLHDCFVFCEQADLSWTNLPIDVDSRGDIDESNVPYERQSVIRDFSQFLMHVIRRYDKRHPEILKQIKIAKQIDKVPLDERKLNDYLDVNWDPVEFMDILIQTRLIFDRYVVKSKMKNGNVIGWRLREIVRSKDGSPYPRNTFDEHRQDQIVYLQSALQVSNADQRYKEWVDTILAMEEVDRADGERFLKTLEAFAASRIRESMSRISANTDFYDQGLQTPRLLFNLIDYLMWVDSKQVKDSFAKGIPCDFVFTYQNSIEHHYPQDSKKVGADEKWSIPAEKMENYRPEDDIGNLYLTSSSENSSMSNSMPSEKVNLYRSTHGASESSPDSLPSSPKRYWMYRRTLDKGKWCQEDMADLSSNVRKLIEKFINKYPSLR